MKKFISTVFMVIIMLALLIVPALAEGESVSVTDITVTTDGSMVPSIIETGSVYQVQVGINNNNETASISPTVTLYEVRSGQDDNPVEAKPVAELAAGTKSTLNFSWTPSIDGNCSLKAVVTAVVDDTNTTLDESSVSVQVIQAATAWDGTVTTAWYNTTDTAFTISNASELAGLAAIVNGTASVITKENFVGKTITLTDNINLGNLAWIPIGTNSYPFAGDFDGNGKYISNLYINATSQYAGLFSANNGVIKNLTIASGSFANTMNYLGAFAGKNAGLILNCVNYASLSGYNYVAGIAADVSGSVANCQNAGSLTSSKQTLGGIAGNLTGTIFNSYNTGVIKNNYGTNNITGGIAGNASGKARIENCYNAGQIKDTTVPFGGVLGYLNPLPSSTCSFVNNYYLDTSAAIGLASPQGTALAEQTLQNMQSKSAAELKALTSSLGDGYKASTSGGYPVLVWQEGGTYQDEAVGLSISSVTAENGSVAVTFNKKLNYTITSTSVSKFLISTKLDSEADYTTQTVSFSSLDNTGSASVVNLTFPKYSQDTSTQNAAIKVSYNSGAEVSSSFAISPSKEWSLYPANAFAGGDGSESLPYQITNAEQLVYLAKTVNARESYAGKFFELTSNINLTGKYWTPIGVYDATVSNQKPFAGTFNGKGYTILGLTIPTVEGKTSARLPYEGLFGYSTGLIKKVNVTGNVTGTLVAGLVAWNAGVIENCNSSVEVQGIKASTNNYVGGIAGYSSGTIYNCYNSGDILSPNVTYVGGIVGYVKPLSDTSLVLISDCDNSGDVQAYATAGGIFGYLHPNSFTGLSVERCSNSGSIRVNYGAAGGIGGVISGGAIKNSYTTGTIYSVDPGSSSDGIGGIVGKITSNGSAQNSYATGEILGALNRAGAVTSKTSSASTSGTNLYYLDGCFPVSSYGAPEVMNAASKTAAELRQAEFVNTLNAEGSSFKADESNINNGYPILLRQSAKLLPTGLTASAPSAADASDGIISGLDTTKFYEYKRVGESGYNKVPEGSDKITGITVGNYYVRICETALSGPSERVKINVPGYITGTLSFGNVSNITYGEFIIANAIDTPAGAELNYKWIRSDDKLGENSVIITGENGRFHYPVAADVGKYITVEVSANGFEGTIKATYSTVVQKAKIPSAPTGLTGIAPAAYGGSSGKITGLDATIIYEYKEIAKTEYIALESGNTEITGLKEGNYHVRIKETDTTNASKETTVTVPSASEPNIYGQVTVTGTQETGNTLTATVSETPSDAVLSYQWQRCNVDGTNAADISEATQNTYTVTEADAGKLLQVKVTASNYSNSLIASLGSPAAKYLVTVQTGTALKLILEIYDELGNSVLTQSGEKSGDYDITTFVLPTGNCSYIARNKESGENMGSGSLAISKDEKAFNLRCVDFTSQLQKSGSTDYTMTVKDINGNSYTSGSLTGKGVGYFVLPSISTGAFYTYAFNPTNDDYWGSRGTMYLYNSNSTENFSTLNLSDAGKFIIAPKAMVSLTVPEGAELHLYHRVRFYRPLEELLCNDSVTLNGYTTYTYDAPAGTSLHYELKLEGYVKRARVFTTSTTQPTALTVNLSDLHTLTENNGYYANDIKDSTQQGFDATVIMNAPDSKYIKLDNGEAFELFMNRAWQAINSGTGNYYVDPDYHVEVIYGDSVTVVDDYYAGATIKAHSTKTGISVIKAIYDALDYVSPANIPLVYSKMWQENYVLIIVNVGEQAKQISINADINQTEYEKFYYTRSINGIETDEDKQYAEYSLKPTAVDNSKQPVAIDSVRVHEPIGDTNWNENNWNDSKYWTSYTAGNDGSYKLKLQDGRSVVEIRAGDATEYYVINTFGLDITITNVDVQKTNEGELTVTADINADVNISFSGLSLPVPKLAAVYNPGYPDTTYLTYSMLGESTKTSSTLEGLHSQYDISTINAISVSFDSPDTYMLSNGKIHTSSIGSSGGTHRYMTRGGLTGTQSAYTEGSNSGETINGLFSSLPNIKINVTGTAEVGDNYDVTITATSDIDSLVVRNSLGYKKAAAGVSGSTYTYSLVNGGSSATYTYYIERSGYITKVGTFTVKDGAVNVDLTTLDWAEVTQSGNAKVNVVGYETVLAKDKSITISATPANLALKGYVVYNYGGYTVLHALLDALDASSAGYNCVKGILAPEVTISDNVGTNAGWVCEVNGIAVTDYAKTLVKSGDSVVFYYNQATSDSMRHAWFTNTAVSTAKDSTASLTLVSTKVSNDGTDPTPVSGATVYIDGVAWGTTDSNGNITLANLAGLALGDHTVTAKLSNALTYARSVLTITKATGEVVVTPNKITVTFRLIGDTKHETAYNGYINWIKTTSYTLDQDSTVETLFKLALNAKGMSYDNTTDNYVAWICAPSVLGSYKLAEFSNGTNSGWMYTVNGVHVNNGLTEQVLEDGDEIIWHYVNDYALETTYEGSIPKYINPWLNAKDTDPYASMANESKKAAESSLITSEDTTATTSITPKVTASNGVANATVSASDITSAIKDALKNSSSSILISPEIKGDTKKISVELPKASVSAVVADTSANLKVQTSIGNVTIPNEVLGSISGQAAGSTLKISLETVDKTSITTEQQTAVGDNDVYDISILSGDKHISNFDGSITVSLPYKLKDGEAADGVVVWYLNDAGKLEQMNCTYDKATGMATFKTTHLSYYLVSFDEMAAWKNTYADVSATSWYYDAVKYASYNSLMSGTSDTSFEPNKEMTRAMLVTVLYRFEGKPNVSGTNSFKDVKDGQWYTNSIIWACEKGIISGYGNGLFGTSDSITREQMAAILFNYAKYKNYNVTAITELTAYNDASAISSWAQAAMKWAKAEELISGITEKTLVPSGNASRAQVATILMRFIENTIE